MRHMPTCQSQMATRYKQHVTPPDRPLHTIYMDTIPNPRPKCITAESRCSHFLFLVDCHTRFDFMYGMNNKSSQEFIRAITKLIAQYGSQVPTGSINTIYTNADTEFKSQAFRSWSSKLKIRNMYAAPEHPHQNGICECHYGTVKEISRKFLVHARFKTHYIYYALYYACLIHNCLPVKSTYVQLGQVTTPWQLFFRKQPRISHLRVFGCPAVRKRHQLQSFH